MPSLKEKINSEAKEDKNKGVAAEALLSGSSEVKRLTVRMPMGTYVALEEYADSVGNSVNGVINIAIIKYIKDSTK